MSSSDDEPPPLALPLAAGAPQPLPHEQPAAPDQRALAAEHLTDAVVAPVPVTLITGYLGAGKTTLVNFILTAKHGCRCAVLLNEIGDSADVERALVKEPEGREAAPLADWVELENGCICCSSKNDMVKALEALMQQRDRFDFIVIETTGLANPGPVAAALWTDAELESSVCLDAVVAVVDAKNILRQLAEVPGAGEGAASNMEGGAVNEAQQQVAFADVVLLNKVDLVSPAQLAEIQREIAAVNADATVLPCHRCEVDLQLILNTGIYTGSLRGPQGGGAGEDAPSASAAPPGGLESGSVAAQPSGEDDAAGAACSSEREHGHEHHPHAEPHTHGGEPCTNPSCSGAGPLHQQGLDEAQRVRTVSVLLRHRPLDLRRLRHWLDELLWEERGAGRPDVLRVKALLWVSGSAARYICQGVYDIYDVVEGPAWSPGEPRFSKLVFIGRRLDRAELEAQLARCLAGLSEGENVVTGVV